MHLLPGVWDLTRCGRRSQGCTRRRRAARLRTWSEIVALYDLLLRIDPSPVVELNRAVAITMRDGPAGLSEIEGLLAKGELDNYPLAHAAKAELCRMAGQMDEAKASFEKHSPARSSSAGSSEGGLPK